MPATLPVPRTARRLTRAELYALADRYARQGAVQCPHDRSDLAVSLARRPAVALMFRCPRCGTAGAFTNAT